MLRFLPVILAIITPTAFAQLNEFEVFPGNDGLGVNAATRGQFGAGEGSLLQGISQQHFRGIGDDGSSCSVHAFQFAVQDQDTATQDPFTLAVRKSVGIFGPQPGAAGLIAGFALLTPVGSGGAGAWLLTVAPTSPLAVPCDAFVTNFYVGIQFPAFPAWPATDGPSIQVRTYAADSITTWCAGDVPSHSWQFIGNPNTPTTIGFTNPKNVWSLALRTPCPTLNIGALGGAISPNFGAPGMFARVGAPSLAGLTFRVRDAANPDGSAILLFGTAFDAPFSLAGFGIKGNLWMTTHLVGQLASTTLDANGESIFSPAWMGAGMLHRFASLCSTPVCFQALTFTAPASNVRATNGAATFLY